jgi:hypothetical protein
MVLIGKRFKMLRSTLALDGASMSGWVFIPAGTLVQVIAGPYGDGVQLVELRWEDRLITMFAGDLAAGTEISPSDAIPVESVNLHLAFPH